MLGINVIILIHLNFQSVRTMDIKYPAVTKPVSVWYWHVTQSTDLIFYKGML